MQRPDLIPTIVFVSSRGGVGKATAPLLLASEQARAAPVTVVDADHPIATGGKISARSTDLLILVDADQIEAAAATTSFGVISLEGMAPRIVCSRLARRIWW